MTLESGNKAGCKSFLCVCRLFPPFCAFDPSVIPLSLSSALWAAPSLSLALKPETRHR